MAGEFEYEYGSGSASAPLVTVPGFTVVRKIGSGGFATVYEAIQDDVNAPVALKVLTVDHADPATRRRFERECKIMGALRGVPGIVLVYSTAFTPEGRPVIVMDYMEGGSLFDAIIRSGSLGAGPTRELGTRIASVLAVAHDRGIFHRDIKPENILLDAGGEAALADFGIAVLDDLKASTRTVASLTPPHAPPERFLANEDVDPALSDVYSLASTLYHALAGRPPFGTVADGGLAALVNRIVGDPVPPLIGPGGTGVPADLVEAIEAGMAKNPQDRPRSASEFASILGAGVVREAGRPPSTGGAPVPVLPQSNASTAVSRTAAVPDGTSDSSSPERSEPAETVVLGGRPSGSPVTVPAEPAAIPPLPPARTRDVAGPEVNDPEETIVIGDERERGAKAPILASPAVPPVPDPPLPRLSAQPAPDQQAQSPSPPASSLPPLPVAPPPLDGSERSGEPRVPVHEEHGGPADSDWWSSGGTARPAGENVSLSGVGSGFGGPAEPGVPAETVVVPPGGVIRPNVTPGGPSSVPEYTFSASGPELTSSPTIVRGGPVVVDPTAANQGPVGGTVGYGTGTSAASTAAIAAPANRNERVRSGGGAGAAIAAIAALAVSILCGTALVWRGFPHLVSVAVGPVVVPDSFFSSGVFGPAIIRIPLMAATVGGIVLGITAVFLAVARKPVAVKLSIIAGALILGAVLIDRVHYVSADSFSLLDFLPLVAPAGAVALLFFGTRSLALRPPRSGVPTVTGGAAAPTAGGFASLAPTTNGFAIAALVCALVGGCGVGSILAIVFGARARREIDASAGTQVGRGMATAGLVIGWIGTIAAAALVVAAIVITAAGPDGRF